MNGTRWVGLIILIVGIILLIIAGASGRHEGAGTIANTAWTNYAAPANAPAGNDRAANAPTTQPPAPPAGGTTQPPANAARGQMGGSSNQPTATNNAAGGYGTDRTSASRAWLWILGVAGVIIGALMLIFGGAPKTPPPSDRPGVTPPP